MAIKKIIKMKKLNGTVPILYSRELIFDMCRVINSHSDAIDYLVEIINEQEERIELLERRINEIKKWNRFSIMQKLCIIKGFIFWKIKISNYLFNMSIRLFGKAKGEKAWQ